MLLISTFRKYLSVIVLMFFLFNIVGYYLWFSYAKNQIQREIRDEIRSGLAEKDLTLITVSINDEAEICWLKAGKEFVYRGEMYDIVKIKIDKDRKFFYCINDTKEKKLITDFSKQHQTDSKTRKLLSSFQFHYMSQPGSSFYFPETSDHEYLTQLFKLKSSLKEVTIPPPKEFFQA